MTHKAKLYIIAIGLVSLGFILGWIKGAYDATTVIEEMNRNAIPELELFGRDIRGTTSYGAP